MKILSLKICKLLYCLSFLAINVNAAEDTQHISQENTGKHEDKGHEKKHEGEKGTTLQALGTIVGCTDALNSGKYPEINIKQTMSKIQKTHFYDSAKDAPQNDQVQFDSNVVGKAKDLLSYIKNHCSISDPKYAKTESRPSSSDTHGACYFTCTSEKPIGMYWDKTKTKHLPTNKIKLSYGINSNTNYPNTYYLFSIFPSHPEK